MTIDVHSWPGIPANHRGWGPGWPDCQTDKWTAAPTPIFGKLHQDIVELVGLLVAETERRGYHLKGDGQTAGTSQCWGADCRAIKPPPGSGVVSNTPSNHSWGLAVDLNSVDNAYGGTRHDIPTWMAELWNAYGFRWGGSWSASTKDWMHFDFMGTPAQADEMTAKARSAFGGEDLELTDKEKDQLNALMSFVDNLGEELVSGYRRGADGNMDKVAKAVADLLRKAAGV